MPGPTCQPSQTVEVVTPASLLRVLGAGYSVRFHSSADLLLL